VYFGFVAKAGNPKNLASGIVKMAPDGVATWVSAQSLVGSASAYKPAMNSAIAVSNDQKTIYVIAKEDVPGARGGYLLALDSTTLNLKNKSC